MSARFFTQDIQGDAAYITGEDVLHLSRVLRLRVGDRVELSDGAGTDYDGTILELAPQRAVLALTGRRPSPGEPPCRVTLFQCLPKAAKMETIIQKTVELGIWQVTPTLSRRCVAEPGDFDKKLVRYRRVALEAAKQSRRGIVPQVTEAMALTDICFDAFDTVLAAYELERGFTLKMALRDRRARRNVALIIGPEGGFDPDEAQQMAGRGAFLVSLGPRILRTETAGPAMLSQLMYEVEQ